MLHRLLSNGLVLLVALLVSAAAFAADRTAKPGDDPASWKPEVKALYEEIRAMPAPPRDGVLVLIHKLAAYGADARPAIQALAADRTLPEPHRAWSGIIAASYVRYDPKALRGMAERRGNPFARREAIDRLVDIGGTANKTFLEALGRKDVTVRDYIEKALPRAPAVESSSEDDRRLLSAILLESIERKKIAALLLVDRHKGRTDMDEALVRLTSLSIADTNAQIYAALALAKIHAADVPKLKALASRTQHRFVRYHAMQELARSGAAGEAVLRELAAAPDEPLKAIAEKFLAGR